MKTFITKKPLYCITDSSLRPKDTKPKIRKLRKAIYSKPNRHLFTYSHVGPGKDATERVEPCSCEAGEDPAGDARETS